MNIYHSYSLWTGQHEHCQQCCSAMTTMLLKHWISYHYCNNLLTSWNASFNLWTSYCSNDNWSNVLTTLCSSKKFPSLWEELNQQPSDSYQTSESPGHKDTFFHFTSSSILHLLGKLLKDFIKTIWSVAIHVSKSMPKDGAHDCSIAVIPPVNGVDLDE